MAIEVGVVVATGAGRVSLSPETDEVAHDDREELRAVWCRRRRIGANEALLYPAVRGATIAIEEIAIVACLVRETLTVAAGRLAATTCTVRFRHASVTAVEGQVHLLVGGVIALFRSLSDAVSAYRLMASTAVIACVSWRELALRIATVITCHVSIVALLDSNSNPIPTNGLADGAHYRTDVARLELTIASAAVAMCRISVVASLATGHLLVPAPCRVHAG